MPKYETYDVLDENQLTAFVSREAWRLDIRQFDPRNRLFASIRTFLQSVEVVDNELLVILTGCQSPSGMPSRTTTPRSIDTGCSPAVSRSVPQSTRFSSPRWQEEFTGLSDS